MRFFFGRFSAILAALLALIAASMPTAASAVEDAEPAATALDQYGNPLAAGVLARLSGARYPHPCPLYAWAYSPDGKTLVSLAEDQVVRFWNTADGRLVRQIDPPSVVVVPWPGQLSISRDGSRLAVAYGSVWIRIVDLTEMKVMHEIRELRPDFVRNGWQTVEFVGRGPLLLAGSENTSYWIDPETGKVKSWRHLGRFIARAAKANLCAFADRNPTDFCRFNNFNADRIDFQPSKPELPARDRDGPFSWPKAPGGRVFALSPDGRFAAVTVLDTLFSFPRKHRRFSPDDRSAAAAVFGQTRKEGILVAEVPSRNIEIYEISTDKLSLSIEVARALIDCLAFSPDGALLVASGPKDAGVWDVRSGEFLTELPASPNHLPYVFSPDGAKLSEVGAGTTIAEWDVASFAQANPSDP